MQISWGSTFKATDSTEALRWERYIYKLHVTIQSRTSLSMNCPVKIKKKYGIILNITSFHFYVTFIRWPQGVGHLIPWD